MFEGTSQKSFYRRREKHSAVQPECAIDLSPGYLPLRNHGLQRTRKDSVPRVPSSVFVVRGRRGDNANAATPVIPRGGKGCKTRSTRRAAQRESKYNYDVQRGAHRVLLLFERKREKEREGGRERKREKTASWRSSSVGAQRPNRELRSRALEAPLAQRETSHKGRRKENEEPSTGQRCRRFIRARVPFAFYVACLS